MFWGVVKVLVNILATSLNAEKHPHLFQLKRWQGLIPKILFRNSHHFLAQIFSWHCHGISAAPVPHCLSAHSADICLVIAFLPRHTGHLSRAFLVFQKELCNEQSALLSSTSSQSLADVPVPLPALCPFYMNLQRGLE